MDIILSVLLQYTDCNNGHNCSSLTSFYKGVASEVFVLQVEYCVELDECAFNAASLNMNHRLKLDHAMSLAEFIQGSLQYNQTWHP